MSARETLSELAEHLAGDPGLEVAVVAKPDSEDDPPEVRNLNLAGDADDFFRGVVDKAVGRRLDPLHWSVRKLDPVYKSDPDDLEWEKTSEIPAVELAVDRYANLAPFDQFRPGDDEFKKRLLYWVAVLTDATSDQKAYFFRRLTRSSELSRKTGAALVAREGTFQVVEEQIFVFDEAIDCFVFGDYLYVIRKSEYRRLFDEFDKVFRRAKRAAKALNERVPISNFDEFEEACSSDSRLADKVIAVKGRDYFDDLSYDTLKPVIDEFNLSINTEKAGEEVQLVFSKLPGERYRILKLVDDDYLRSSMTNHRYEVNSKTEPPAG